MYNQGIDYFPFDVSFFDDDKIVLIEEEFGTKGSYVALRLLCKIYSEGYYCHWGDDDCRLFTRRLGGTFVSKMVNEIVQGLVRRSFFDKGVFDSFHVLTSKGIQQRFFEITKRRKNESNINMQFLVLDEQERQKYGLIPKSARVERKKCIHDVNIFQQSKVKESKEKESKGNGERDKERAAPPPPTESYSKFLEWMETNAPWCAHNLTMPTEGELEQLKRTWHTEDVCAVIKRLENKRNLRTNYSNLMTTVTSWLEMDEERKRINRKNTATTSNTASSPSQKPLSPEEQNELARQHFIEMLQRDAERGSEKAKQELERVMGNES